MKPSEIFETPESSGFNEAVTPHNEMPKTCQCLPLQSCEVCVAKEREALELLLNL